MSFAGHLARMGCGLFSFGSHRRAPFRVSVWLPLVASFVGLLLFAARFVQEGAQGLHAGIQIRGCFRQLGQFGGYGLGLGFG